MRLPEIVFAEMPELELHLPDEVNCVGLYLSKSQAAWERFG
jgi:hypothetical protein